MNTEDFVRLEQLFHEALRYQDGGDRSRFLDEACANSAQLRDQLERLLRADEQGQSKPAEQTDAEMPRFGVFQAERILGRGGTGTVYLARRTDGHFDQLAAVKVVAWEVSDERIRQGFLNERQILAGLSHPGIAQVLDGGVLPNGAPYLVMEYVDGMQVHAYCRERKLGLRERIDLIERICDAVSFAHRNLVVHLDLKPSNVLVTHGAHVKVLDFGTAKALVDPDAAVTQRIGTPLFASPEQLRGERAGMASDVFSLGVIAAELLAGVWPFGDPESGMDRMRRAVEEVQPATLAERATQEHASECGLSLPQLRRALTGDLEAIIGKAIQSDPASRYRSVDEFAADLGAYVDGLPVRARQSSRWYVAKKFVRRHRAAVSVSAAAALALAITAGVAMHERHVAYENYAGMRDLTSSMLFELKDAIRELPGATDAQRILVSRVLKNLDHMQAFSADLALRFDIAECYRQLGELQGSPYVANLGDAKSAIESLGRAERIAQAELQQKGSDTSWLWLAGYIQQNIGEVYFGQNNTQAAAEHLRRATAYFDRMAAGVRDPSRFTDAATAHGVLADVLGSPNLASLFDQKGAEAEYSRAIQMDEEGLRRWPDYERLRRGIPLMRSKRSDLLREKDPRRALEDVDVSLKQMDGLAKTERERPSTRRMRAMIQIKRAEILALLGQWQQARDAMSEPLAFYQERAAADPRDDQARVDLVTTTGKLFEIAYMEPGAADALTLADRVIPLWQELLKKEPGVLIYRTELATAEAHRAVLLQRTGRQFEAKTQAAQARKELQAILRDPKAGQFQARRCASALADLTSQITTN